MQGPIATGHEAFHEHWSSEGPNATHRSQIVIGEPGMADADQDEEVHIAY